MKGYGETYQKYYKIFQRDWSPYVEALNLCTDSVKLTAFHTRECAEQTKKAADYILLAAFYVSDYLKETETELGIK